LIGNDTLTGGDGNDFIVGDQFAVRAPVVTVTANDPAACGFSLEHDWRDGEGWWGRGDRASWWLRGSWQADDSERMDTVHVDSDTISGGAGDDLVYGDSTAMISSTIIRAPNVSRSDFAYASHEISEGLQRLMGVQGGTDLWIEYANQDCDADRNSADTISGGDGNDVLFGQDGLDTVHGDAGDDWLIGGNEGLRDVLDGGTGNNKVFDPGNNSIQLRTRVAALLPSIDLTAASGSYFGAPTGKTTGGNASPWLDDFLNNLGRNDACLDPNAGICIQLDGTSS
jgi:Ca2+-binding RTX toxin-like protein